MVLEGFLIDHHECTASWFFDFHTSLKFRNQIAEDIHEPKQVAEALPLLDPLTTVDEKEAYLKRYYPTVYVAILRSMKRTEELDALFSGKVNEENMKWYVHIVLLPKLTKMRKEGKLLHNQQKEFEAYSFGYRKKYKYIGDTDLDGNACGWGKEVSYEGTFTGTFLNDKMEGIMVSDADGDSMCVFEAYFG